MSLLIGDLWSKASDEFLSDKPYSDVLNQMIKESDLDPAIVETEVFDAWKIFASVRAFPNLPDIFKQMPNWVSWRLETTDTGKTTKIPFQCGSQKHASSTNPDHWSDFGTAVVTRPRNDSTGGIGFVIGGLAIEQKLTGFDLDGCRDIETGTIAPWAMQIVELLNSYTEITPSGTGLRVWVKGTFPDGANVFKLNTAAGFGTKVQIEVFSHSRYFTMTGNSLYGDTRKVEARDLAEAYKLCLQIKKDFPTTPKTSKPVSFDNSDVVSGVQIHRTGTVITSKLELLMNGDIVSESPLVIEDQFGQSISYPSRSEADLALATLLAFEHDGDSDLMWESVRASSLYREKWERDDYREDKTFGKAIASYRNKKSKSEKVMEIVSPTQAAVTTPQPSPVEFDPLKSDQVPDFDPSVINGIFKEIVDAVCEGTTIPRQFPFLAAKVYTGARMAGKVKFDGLDCDSSYYGAAIGTTGTGKGFSWRRFMQLIQVENDGAMVDALVKVIHGADSGAGLKDVFFETSYPVVLYIDEITTLGHKAADKKQPEIIDNLIELADTNTVSRVLAKRKGQKASRTVEARLSAYICGQDGPAFTGAFAGRTKLGIFDRLYPEYSPEIEAGEIPDIDPQRAEAIWLSIQKLDFSGRLTMAVDVKAKLELFWKSQPNEIRKKVRFKKHLMLDMYLTAFGRGSRIAEISDLDTAVGIFTRQMAIRKANFTFEVPDRPSYYAGLIKKILIEQRRRLNAGEAIHEVAMSIRDYQTATHAFRDNEFIYFNMGWKATQVYSFALNGGAWKDEVQSYTGTNSGALLSTVTDCWNFVTITSGTCVYTTTSGTPATGVHKLAESTTLPVPSGSITKTNQYTFDGMGNITKIQENNYYTGSLPAADRTTTIGYLGGTSYIAALIVNRPSSVVVTNSASSTVAKTTYCYDYASGCGGTSFSSVTGMTNHDDTNYSASNTVRGDLTQLTSYITTSTSLSKSIKYDTTGQVTSATDTNTNANTYTYSGYSNAYPTTIKNAFSQSTILGYDANTGLITSEEDPNSQTASLSYDGMMRPLSITNFDGGNTGLTYNYSGTDYTGSTATTAVTSLQNMVTTTTVDSMGRDVLSSVTNDPGGATMVATTFDINGRVKTVSNPYRSTSDYTYGVQTPSYDGLDRVTQTTE